MSLQFLGKTAIITGAGGAIGRSYALELAKRGCNVVVNDVGSTLTGGTSNNDPAGKVVKEILDKGGKAIANYHNVLEGDKIVESALKSFGRCDIVINNAGILRDKSMTKMTKEDWRAVLDVHLEGTFNLCHAAWPIMQSQKYGRIINIGSGAGLYGNFGQANYSSAKMAILGLTNTLAVEGEKYNIKVNCVVPVAGSRMTETVLSADMLKLLDPQHIVPIVAYLAHESSEQTGSCFEVGGGWYSQVRFQRSAGISLSPKDGAPASVEDLARNMHIVTDFSDSSKCTYPTSPASALREMLLAQENAGKPTTVPAVAAAVAVTPVQTENSVKLPSDKIFERLQHIITNDRPRAVVLAGKMKARVAFNITSGSASKKWIMHLKANEDPAVFVVPSSASPSSSASASAGKDIAAEVKPDVTLICSDATLLSLSDGSLSPEYAYMRGLLQVKGQMNVALKVKLLLLDVAGDL